MEYINAKILSNMKIADGLYSMKLAADSADVKPGQFYMLQPKTALLGRPISVCETGNGWIEFCYAVIGKGTQEFSELREGDSIWITGALGNGFDMEFINTHKRVAVVSGSIGVAPFVELCKRLTCDFECFCGFHQHSFLTERIPNVHVATENGTEGHKGFVTELFDPKDFDLVLACGSDAFLRAVAKMCEEAKVPSLLSMDKHMACGVGACLCCTCKTVKGNKRCCIDGPVFSGGELIW